METNIFKMWLKFVFDLNWFIKERTWILQEWVLQVDRAVEFAELEVDKPYV